MRVARAVQAGRGQGSLQLYDPNSIFRRKLASNATLATDQTPALKLANQCNYGNSSYSYNNTTAPLFYGYSGLGYGGHNVNFQNTLNFSGGTIALYIVDSFVSTQTVTLVQSDGVTPRPAGANNNLQAGFNAVPVPDVTKIPQGQIWPAGSDKAVTIWRPTTNELWELWEMSGSPSAYVFQYGGYTNAASSFNGIWGNGWGTSASGLGNNGGVISIQDVIDVLHGLPIRHALKIDLQVIANSRVAPAVRNDTNANTSATTIPQFEADGTTANPAYSGFPDAVPEGTWLRFPTNFNPSSAMPSAGPLALAIAAAIRDYGIYVSDGSGNCNLKMEDPRVLGSPYSYAKINPFTGSTGPAAGYFDSYINNNVASTWTDATLAKITEPFSGSGNLLVQIPWQQLQVLEPFSS